MELLKEMTRGENQTPKKQANGNEPKVDRRKFNKRDPKSGRKPKEANIIARDTKAEMEKHFSELVPVKIRGKDGTETIVMVSRTIRALQKLYEIGTINDGNADALNKWLDRNLGKPAQVIKGDENEPVILRIDF